MTISPHVTDSLVEQTDSGLLVLSPANRRVYRRILYVNSYGGRQTWERIKAGFLPPHHFWGCIELVRMGYEVAVAEPLPDFYLRRNPLPHDLRYLQCVRSWLGSEGIVYCGHNVLYWLPLLRSLGAVRSRIVSLLFGREPLNFGRAHSGIIALNGAAANHASKLAPGTPVAQLAWGVDLTTFPLLPYQPEWFLACGQTQRDHKTLSIATTLTSRPVKVISSSLPPELQWASSVKLLTGGTRDDTVSYDELFHNHYANCAASLIILRNDPKEETGVGFTNLLEAMAMARPVIVTRTGALPTEIDVEQTGCGLHVAPNDPVALAAAIESIASDPERARQMGAAGRAKCEQYYNIIRYSMELHTFFDRL